MRLVARAGRAGDARGARGRGARWFGAVLSAFVVVLALAGPALGARAVLTGDANAARDQLSAGSRTDEGRVVVVTKVAKTVRSLGPLRTGPWALPAGAAVSVIIAVAWSRRVHAAAAVLVPATWASSRGRAPPPRSR